MRVAIASPTVLFREELCKILGNTKDIEVIAEVTNISEAMPSTKKLRPEILIIEANVPNLDLINAIRAARKRHPRLKVLLLMNRYNENTIISAMQLGAVGWLLKDTSSLELVEALRTLNKGEPWVDKKFRTSKDTKPRFTEREAQVVEKLTDSKSNKDIARELFISERTVKVHLSHIYRKLNIQNRYQLLSSIIEQQFIEIEPKRKLTYRGGLYAPHIVVKTFYCPFRKTNVEVKLQPSTSTYGAYDDVINCSAFKGKVTCEKKCLDLPELQP